MIAESLLNKEGVADGIGHRPENSPQITVLSGLMEHLPASEGLDESGSWCCVGNGFDKPFSRSFSQRRKRCGELGTGFGDRTSESEGAASAQEVADFARVLSESTNSSM